MKSSIKPAMPRSRRISKLISAFNANIRFIHEVDAKFSTSAAQRRLLRRRDDKASDLYPIRCAIKWEIENLAGDNPKSRQAWKKTKACKEMIRSAFKSLSKF